MIHNVHKAVWALGAGLLLIGVNALEAGQNSLGGILRPAPRIPTSLLRQAAATDNRPVSAWSNDPYVPAVTDNSQRSVSLIPNPKSAMSDKSVFSMENIEENKPLAGLLAGTTLAAISKCAFWCLTPSISGKTTIDDVKASISKTNGYMNRFIGFGALLSFGAYAYKCLTADDTDPKEAKKNTCKGIAAGAIALAGAAWACNVRLTMSS